MDSLKGDGLDTNSSYNFRKYSEVLELKRLSALPALGCDLGPRNRRLTCRCEPNGPSLHIEGCLGGGPGVASGMPIPCSPSSRATEARPGLGVFTPGWPGPVTAGYSEAEAGEWTAVATLCHPTVELTVGACTKPLRGEHFPSWLLPLLETASGGEPGGKTTTTKIILPENPT
jgi:hypothetical protein